MAFDPIQEDCLRLILAAAEREGVHPIENPAVVERLTQAFQADPSSLIATDADRSFHLVAKATELLDYRVPFIADEVEAEAQVVQAEAYLREAIELDAGNWDAQRMLATTQSASDDELVCYLLDNRDAVARDAASVVEQARTPHAVEFARDLGQRPYQRWNAALASRLLIAGQYRRSMKVAEETLAAYPLDLAGVRHTGMLALAKLEVEPVELERYRSRHAVAYQHGGASSGRRARPSSHKPDAWTLIAQMSLAYRAFDFDAATAALNSILRVYPRAAQPLYVQAEFPDGVFSRVNVAPGSEDELILALSEATPLLQEGMGTPDSASFALWVAEHDLVRGALSPEDLETAFQMFGGAAGGGAQ